MTEAIVLNGRELLPPALAFESVLAIGRRNDNIYPVAFGALQSDYELAWEVIESQRKEIERLKEEANA